MSAGCRRPGTGYPLAELGPDEPQVLFDGPPDQLTTSSDQRVRQFIAGEAGDRLEKLRSTVWRYFDQWRHNGTLDTIHDLLRTKVRTLESAPRARYGRMSTVGKATDGIPIE